MSDDEVREAEAALKGMLGISGGGVVEVSSSSEGRQGQGLTSKKVKKKRNKKSGEGKGSGGKRGGGGKQREEKEYSRHSSEGSNFAWSAFQSSPDASALPIPIFSSTTSNDNYCKDNNDIDNNDNDNNKETQDKLPAILTSGAIPQQSVPPQQNMRTAEDLENEVIASLAHTPRHHKQKQQHKEKDNKEKEEQQKDQLQDTATGVNLAAFASPQTSSKPPSKSPATQTQSQHAHNETANATATPSQQSAPNNTEYYHQNYYHHQHHQHQQYSSPYHTGHAHQQMHSPPYPYSHHHQHFSSPLQQQHAPPMHNENQNYVTVPVQVPPVIPPNRQIMVPTPNGYLPVLLPEGVSPGMVVPVTLPVLNHTHAHAHHQQQHHYPPPQTISPQTPTNSQKQPSKQKNTSWAAKVKASPTSSNNKANIAKNNAQQ